LSKILVDFHFIPKITAAVDEWHIYRDITANKEVLKDIVALWHACSGEPAYITLPVSSVDVERSF